MVKKIVVDENKEISWDSKFSLLSSSSNQSPIYKSWENKTAEERNR
jgi:hypothetical protein